MSAGRTVGGGRATAVLARVALRRLVRSKTWWIAALLALAPVVMGLTITANDAWQGPWAVLVILMIVVPPLLVAAPVSEEIEERTYTYLWSRPLPRWSMVAGKLVAGWPVAAALLGGAAAIAHALAAGRDGVVALPGLGVALGAVAVGALGTSMVAAGVAALAPHLAQRLTYVYLAVDLLLGALRMGIQNLSMSHHVRELGTGGGDGSAIGHAIGCLAIGAVWLAIGLVRLRRAEYADGKS